MEAARNSRQRPAPRRANSDTTTSAAMMLIVSQTGGPGIRQLGSRCACHAAADCETANSHPAIFAGTLHPVNTARNPTGTARHNKGTMTVFAESPENDTRWK